VSSAPELGYGSSERELLHDVVSYDRDPLGFVKYAFRWGVGELADADGPRRWQRDVLAEVGEKLRANPDLDQWESVQQAVASGHGVGKSALVAMLVLWAMSTAEDTRAIVTANTETQLRTKTWPEIAKWYRLCITRHWFELTATKLCSIDPDHAENWRCDIIPWSENNTEAFAGLHNKGKRILIVFDESSAIHDKIWEVTEGVLTDEDTEILWFAFGNPTRQAGRFALCFGKFAHRWRCRHIDSRDVEGTNKAQIAKLVEDYGENSDIVRVRVRGLLPLQAEYQLISQEAVAAAQKRPVVEDRMQAVVAGLDIARSGSCETVLAFRVGRDARSIRWCAWRERDSVVLAGKITQAVGDLRRRGLRVHTIFADGGGLGGPVVDLLKHYEVPVHEVLFGSKATNENDYLNKGSEMWARMRDWMDTGSLPDDPELESQLVTRDYRFDPKAHKLALVPKDVMISQGLPSPDRGDALALTFAFHVEPKEDVQIEAVSHQCVNDL
jgi:hypothetical protein